MLWEALPSAHTGRRTSTQHMTAESARLFLGLELSDEARLALASVRQDLIQVGLQAKFHPPSLYHLTLAFLGMTPVASIPHLKELMSSVSCAPFSLTLSSLGTFKDGRILWAGIKDSPSLTSYQSQLTAALLRSGFFMEQTEYRPHITLARQVKSPVPCFAVPEISFSVSHSTLFESTRLNGELTYLPLYRSVFY